MLAIQPWARNERNEELRAIGVRASIGHRKEVGLLVSDVEVLVGKSTAVDALGSTLKYSILLFQYLSTSSIASSEVASLGHKVVDDSMEA